MWAMSTICMSNIHDSRQFVIVQVNSFDTMYCVTRDTSLSVSLWVSTFSGITCKLNSLQDPYCPLLLYSCHFSRVVALEQIFCRAICYIRNWNTFGFVTRISESWGLCQLSVERQRVTTHAATPHS